MKRYYSLYKQENTANIHIYGEITSFPWFEGEISSYNLSKELQELEDVDNINVYINSYGGEVAEGLAIYNALKRHKAKITTITDGFACSIASVIFAAGDERVMSDPSLLMIHDAWSGAVGNSSELKKQAEDLEKVNQSSVKAYMSIVNIKEDELKQMMKDETWLDQEEALSIGFATKIAESNDKQVASQSIRQSMINKIMNKENYVAQVVTPKLAFNDEFDIDTFVQKIADQLKESRIQAEPVDPEQMKNKPLNMMKALFNTKGDN